MLEKSVLLQESDDRHHPDQEEDDVQTRKFDDVRDVDQTRGQKNGLADESEGESELPVEKCSAEVRGKDSDRGDLSPGKS